MLRILLYHRSESHSANNSSIADTSMPIFAMILLVPGVLSALRTLSLEEGYRCADGCKVARIIIIPTSATAGNAKVGNIWGDRLHLGTAFVRLYLALFAAVQKLFALSFYGCFLTLATLLLHLAFLTIGHVSDISPFSPRLR